MIAIGLSVPLWFTALAPARHHRRRDPHQPRPVLRHADRTRLRRLGLGPPGRRRRRWSPPVRSWLSSPRPPRGLSAGRPAAAPIRYTSRPSAPAGAVMPLERYRSLIQRGELRLDPLQEAAAARLDRLARELEAAPAPPPRTAAASSPASASAASREPAAAPRGVYLHGGVGRGKSMLMDLFVADVRGRAAAPRPLPRVHARGAAPAARPARGRAGRGSAADPGRRPRQGAAACSASTSSTSSTSPTP